MLGKAFAIVAVLAVAVSPVFAAMTVKDFKKLRTEDQSTYIGAAVSMLAYTYAADGKTAKARCIQDFYYGQPGKPTPGPAAITVELAIAEAKDAARFTVEGVILGVTDKFCDPPANKPVTDKE